ALWRQRLLILRIVAVGQVAVFIGFVPIASLDTARRSTEDMRQLTGVVEDPLAEYKRLPHVLADVPPDTPVNLVIPTEALKHRQMVAYFLRRPVIADWSDDVYLGNLDPAYRNL